MKRFIALLSSAGLAAASSLALATPASASVSCGTSRIESTAYNLPIRTQSSVTAPTITTAQPGYQYNCSDVWLSEWYSACGQYTNRWVEIGFRSGMKGYTYAACVKFV